MRLSVHMLLLTALSNIALTKEQLPFEDHIQIALLMISTPRLIDTADLIEKQATRLAALEGMTKLANSLGQAMDAMAHAMQSENGQL